MTRGQSNLVITRCTSLLHRQVAQYSALSSNWWMVGVDHKRLSTLPAILKQFLSILNLPLISSGFRLSPASNQGDQKTLNLHRFLEAVKFANGQKHNLKDPNFGSRQNVWIQLHLTYCGAWVYVEIKMAWFSVWNIHFKITQQQSFSCASFFVFAIFGRSKNNITRCQVQGWVNTMKGRMLFLMKTTQMQAINFFNEI